MKKTTLWKPTVAMLCGLLLIIAGMVVAFAQEDVPEVPTEEWQSSEEGDIPTEMPIYTDPPTDPPTEPVTDPPTEPVTDPVTEVVTTQEPAATTQEQTDAPTTANGGGYIDDNHHNDPQVTEFVPPTIPKTVSEKSYSTNYAFGIVSWICVLVGLIVMFVVAVSTKVSGYRANRRV